MKTVEELEAELETVTRERDLSLFAWEAAGMTGRDAQSAMLELARQLEEARAWQAQTAEPLGYLVRAFGVGGYDVAEPSVIVKAWRELERACDEARDTIVALTTAKAEADLEIATLTAALDERDVEAERSLEQYDRLVRERDEARAEVERLRRMPVIEMMCENESVREYVTQLEKRVERAGVERLAKERDDARYLLTQARSAVEHERDRLSDCEHDPAFCTCDEAAKMSALLARIDVAFVAQAEGSER